VAGLVPVLAILVFGWFAYLDEVILRTLFRPGPSTATFLGPFSFVLPLAAADLRFDLTWPGIVLATAGAVLALRSNDLFPSLFLLAWGGLFFYAGNNVAYSPRYLSLITAPFFAFMGVGIAALAHWRARTGWLAVLLTCALAVYLFLQIEPIVRYRTQHVGGRDYALWLRDQVPEHSVVVVMDDAPFIEYYGGLKTLQHPVLDPAATSLWVEEVVAMVRAGTPVYINTSGFSLDPDGRIKKALLERFRLVPAGQRLTEDYHRSAIELRIYVSKLYRLELR
jgi:hypothetical protein